MHYSWSTEARARRALANVSALLRPGGTFIGTMPDANVIIKKLREGFFLVPCHLVVSRPYKSEKLENLSPKSAVWPSFVVTFLLAIYVEIN